MTSVRKVMFPVAGMGTRFLPATKSTPKEMLPVVDKPLIQYAVEEALTAGIDTLVFITSGKKQSIAEHFDSAAELEARLREQGRDDLLALVQDIVLPHIQQDYVLQPQPLGLGHAVLCGRDAIGKEPFGVILPDDLIKSEGPGCLAEMVQLHERTGASVLAVEEVEPAATGRYGIVSTVAHGDGLERIDAIVEKPAPADAPSNLAVVGRYILTANIFRHLESIEPGAGGEIQLTDAISALLMQEPVLCYRFPGTRYDCGDRFGLIQATLGYALDHPDLGPRCRAYLRKLLEDD